MKRWQAWTLGAVFLLTLAGSHVALNGLPDIDLDLDFFNQRADRVVYVYEKNANGFPAWLAGWFRDVNESGQGVAMAFEVDTLDGEGEVPEQFKAAVEAVIELPSLVALKGDRVLSVTVDPKAVEDIPRYLRQ